MSLKGWLLTKVHGSAARAGSRVAPSLNGDAGSVAETEGPRLDDRDADRGMQRYLGPYAPLVAAIRDELAAFAESQLRLHLAIAERDRYVLTSIEVACEGDDVHAALLRRFTDEFTPEQIKRFLARDIIAGLRNASAIDLSQFAGLNVESARVAGDGDDPYQALIADLKAGATGAGERPFDVSLVGRWVQTDAPMPSAPARPRADERTARGGLTPLAMRAVALDIEDARGARRVELSPLVPGRRYVVGKDDGCDVVVDGVYASRRHAELWFDPSGGWVADAGSTNGIRVESGNAAVRAGPGGAERDGPLEVPAGATIVLSAHAQGDARHYPRLRVQPALAAPPATKATQVTAAPTPPTPLAPLRRQASLRLAARTAAGTREIDLRECPLPFGIGRSRNQSLVIDGAHADVSGRHVEIVALDDDGASVVVLGDNGVVVDGVAHATGARFRWKRGETMLLGRADAQAPACTISLVTGA
ncbi:MAG TPA: FHA domain-containing protein [Casimicrobiaceae bacterium]|nr:FHA domain-containing protein [Casimicrobiaceae bacterium]